MTLYSQYFVDCGDPPEIIGAYPKQFNSIVEYKCQSTNDDIYEIEGNPEISCQPNGT